jgi:Flp pilus assembly pilin Flp
MEYFRLMLRGLNGDRRAVTAVEYALIASLVAVALAVMVPTLTGALTGAFTTITNNL